jgi:predicted nucleic acid-binding protein/GNAT superfamily N-acetyltransferase
LITTRTIHDATPELLKVIKLAQSNSATLGFLPKGAFANYATHGQLIGAFENNNELIGYLLYAVNIKGRFVYLVHLCVEEKFRQKGTAHLLFNDFKERTKKHYRGVRVRCRRDYEATKVWQKLGFAAVDDTVGRSKQGSTLTIWWFDYGHPDLFSQSYSTSSETKVQVVIDANIFFELQHPHIERNKGSLALLNDWLQESVELCLTQEIFNEINRHSDPEIRKKARTFASTFAKVNCEFPEFERILTDLYTFFSKPISERDESDFRQLAWAIGAEIPFFITRDKKLLRMTDKIYSQYGIQIWRPSLLILNQDNLNREVEYQPARLTGSHFILERLQVSKAAQVEDLFYCREIETKAEFRNRLHSCLSEPQVFDTRLISKDKEPFGLIVTDRRVSKELKIPLFRVSTKKLSATLARHLLHNTIITASKELRALTVIEEPYISPIIMDALPELGFVACEDLWIKVNLSLVDTAENISFALNFLYNDFPKFSSHFKNLASSLNIAFRSGNKNELLLIEKALWPAKITDLNLGAFIIPIRPQWALHLFDPNFANQDLFGSEPALIFNIENAYYRSRRPMILSAPARILWYVSKGKTKLKGTMSIRACSYLEEVVIDKPKAVFSRFRRLGVYKWPNIYDIAKHDVNNSIMAFRFSNTELFDNPIDLKQLKKIWNKKNKSTFFPVTPIKTDNEMFLELYRIGKKYKLKEPTYAD